MIRRTSLFLLAFMFGALATAACTRAPVSPVTEALKAEPAAPKPPDPCEVLLARIQRVADEAPNRCTHDEDCAMYGGGTIDCGKALDQVSASEVDRLSDEFRKLGCNEPFACAPRSARAICDDGRCIEVSDREYDEILEKRRLAEQDTSRRPRR